MLKQFILRIIKILNVVFLTIPFCVSWFEYYGKKIYSPFYYYGNWAVIFIFAAFYIVFARIYDALSVSHYRVLEMVYSQMLAITMSDVFIYLVICLLSKGFPDVKPGVCVLFLQFILSVIWSTLSHWWYFHTFSASKSAIVFENESKIEELIYEYSEFSNCLY